MQTFTVKTDALTGEGYYEVFIRGRQLVNDPLLNKLSCFSEEERHTLGLDGLIGAHISTLDEQYDRTMEMYSRKADDLERYIFLHALLDRCEVLFYDVLCRNLSAMAPIVYTPTVGQACLQMSHIMRRFRGVYLTPDNIANIDQIFRNLSRPEIDLIVVTDGERILGLGDLGSDGMGISVGKVNLYVAAGGLHHACVLPVCLDVGTNNEQLLADPLYLGYRRRRLRGDAYFKVVERFALGVKRSFPNALVQWEDFAKDTAFDILERYRSRLLSFDDDIQGTGAVARAALQTAMRIKRGRLADERFVVAGLGQAGVGIATNLRNELAAQGLDDREIHRRLFAVDKDGLVIAGEETDAWQRPFAQSREAVAGWHLRCNDRIELADVVANTRATVLIGVTAQAGLFGPDVLQTVASHTPQPIILSLSNPTASAECTLAQAVEATSGKCLYASGSPQGPVSWSGREVCASQCNNLFIFPGVGLGALIAQAPKVTVEMFRAASDALSRCVTAEQERCGLLLPALDDIREVTVEVALAVAVAARESGLGRVATDAELEGIIRAAQWQPRFNPYRPGVDGRTAA